MTRKHPHHGNRRRGTHPKPRKPRKLLSGTLRVARPGASYVKTEEGTFPVARRGVREAMNGDEVQVSLVPMHGSSGVPVAYVQGVLRRACETFLGTYEVVDPLGVVSPLDARVSHDFFVLPEDVSPVRLGVTPGDLVAARIVEYPTRQTAGVVTLERRLGASEELDLAVEGVIASHGLATSFSEEVLADAARVGDDVQTSILEAGRRDLRDRLCVTVDPADARDFDDAVGARACPDGGFELDVHIADVTHYLVAGSPMDEEARRRTCSVYLADRVLPMLPERLCNDLCSLRPGCDRLAMSVLVRLDPRGEVVSAEAAPSAIRSRARLSYDQVDALLDGAAAAGDLPCGERSCEEVARMLGVLDEVASLRRKVRRDRGAIDFQTSEAKVMLDEAGHPTGVSVRERTRATSLVEEAMLVANECVARMLSDRDVCTAYRVHERPSPEDLADCVPALRGAGLLAQEDVGRFVSADPVPIQRILRECAGKDASHLVNALLLRAQKRALYLPHNDGHYALGARAYCHFTSPIRRYPDVLVHRSLKQLLGVGRVGEGDQGTPLAQLCRTCSERERVADAAERASQRVKMAELYADKVGRACSGVVVGIERHGLFVLLDETHAEGFLANRDGEERAWRLGQRVAVEVAGVEVARGRIDLRLARPHRV